MFTTVLVANRGEIAVRVFRTLRQLGIRSVAVYSDADAAARHVREADVAVRLGPAAAAESYLSIEKVLAAAEATGAQAIHPGYGFLAESVAFAAACEKAGIVLVGPPVHAIEVMGDKIRAKQAVTRAGVPVVPGRSVPDMTDPDLVDAADEVGYPVLVKPSAGGGGKGMRLVEHRDDLPAALVSARREAASSFGDDTLFLERFVHRPRHIEVQVMADAHGTTVHLGERECSLQRRHQKVVEEAPSPLLDAATRARIGAAAVATAQAVGYTGAGTVEFIVSADAPDDFFFMEMNTRLQVEHPVTELVTGYDLVEMQLRVAAGEPLGITQADVLLTGHAVEARLYAEDPARGFLPTGGRALLVREPTGEGVRVDSSLLQGVDLGTTYDPMLAKVIAWAPTRTEALARLERALGETVLLGSVTNAAFVRALIAAPEVRAGDLDTELLARLTPSLLPPVPALVHVAFALARLAALEPTGAVVDPWTVPGGWRIGAAAPVRWIVAGPLLIAATGRVAGATVTVGEAEPVAASALVTADGLLVTCGGRTHGVIVVHDGPTTWLHVDGVSYAVTELVAERSARAGGAASGEVRSPMPGLVVAVTGVAGSSVSKGAPIAVVEAMKMEHTLVAPFDGTLTTLSVRVGDQVVVDQSLFVIVPDAVEA